MPKIHHLPIQVYYEDTDHSGAVYYANYLKYFERAREYILGIELLVNLWEQQRIGFAVYKVAVTYLDAAKFGDALDVQTWTKMDGDYRIIWHQDIWRKNGDKPIIKGQVELVCLKNAELIAIPEQIIQLLNSSNEVNQ